VPIKSLYIAVRFHSKHDMIPLTCLRDPGCIWDRACNQDPAYISTNYIDLRPVSHLVQWTRPLCGTRLLPEVLRYSIQYSLRYISVIFYVLFFVRKELTFVTMVNILNFVRRTIFSQRLNFYILELTGI